MKNTEISIQQRTKKFAVRIVQAYSAIINANHFNDAIVILAKQLLRSGTSIGANCSEAKSAQSTKDFINKYEIALKEARETAYWIEVMIESEIIPQRKFSSLLDELNRIIRILVATINSLKKTLDS